MATTATTLADRGRAFRALHEREGAFIIPNPWDVGTARLLAHMGLQALATTSAGYAFSLGRCDQTVSRQASLTYAAAIASATSLPVSADLENGFGDAPQTVAETVRLAAAAGVVGVSAYGVSPPATQFAPLRGARVRAPSTEHSGSGYRRF